MPPDPQVASSRVKMLQMADVADAKMNQYGRGRTRRIIQHAIDELEINNNGEFLLALQNLRHVPVTMEEFLESKDFYRDQYEELWPNVKADLMELNPDILTGALPIHEYLDGGATATAKSFKAMATQAYQLYVLNCYKRPQALFRLAYTTPIVFMFQSVSEKITRRVLYEPFRLSFTSMPFVKRHMNWDNRNESSLLFTNNVHVVPALASITAMVGQAIISAIMDEVSFMSVIMNSVQVPGAEGKGGFYDQAELVHSTLTRRRKGRFLTSGPSPGCITVLSSVRYKKDFISKKIDEHEANPQPHRRAFRRAQYDVQPQDKYKLPRFKVLVGSDNYASRILTDKDVKGKHYPANARVENVPGEFLEDFKSNPEGALRDYCGIASDTLAPFITQRHKIIEATQRWLDAGRKSWVDKQNVELLHDGMPQIVEANLPKDKSTPRYVHIDLSRSSDRCGIAIVKVAGFVNQSRGADDREGHVEVLPHFVVEEVLTIKPSPAKEIDISEVRNWVMLLKTFYKLNIVGVTYDGFDSQESISVWRKAGMWSDVISMDKTPEAYEVVRSAMYDGRLDLADNELVRLEFTHLEYNSAKGKVDHPPKGSKDGADAVAGAISAANTARAVRSRIGVQSHEDEDVRDGGRRSIGERPSSGNRR